MSGSPLHKHGPSPASATPTDVLVRTFHQVLRLLFVSWLLAWLLTKTSGYLLLNLPVAVALVFAAKWLAAYIDQRVRLAGGGSGGRPRPLTTIDWRSASFVPHVRLDDTDRDAWRAAVNAKRVELAWEQFCNSVLQEWVYDAWYAYMTPDREFPAEVRKLLNNVFGELCIRARNVDLRTALVRDVSEIVIENLQLYRQTVEAIGAESLQYMPPAKREAALQRELKSEGRLHTALQTPDGHYQVLRSLSDGVVRLVLPPQERELAMARAIVRELLAACVLRPTMMYFTPYSINQIFLSMFPSDPQPAARPAGTGRQHFEGSQGFNERARQSAVLENAFMEQQASQSQAGGSQQVSPSAALVEQDFAPVPASVAVGVSQAYKRPAHLRSRSWDDHLLPASHALQSTYDSLILSTLDSLQEDGFRSDGDQQSSRHPAHQRPPPTPPARTDLLNMEPIHLTASPSSRTPIPDPAARPASPPPAAPSPDPSSMSRATSERGYASVGASLQPSPAGSPTRAGTPVATAPSASSAPSSPQAPLPQQAAVAPPGPLGRPAFDEVQEATAASLLQHHPNLQEQLAAGGQLQAAVLSPYTLNDGSKDFVLYPIKVCEGESMWGVSRRYRNFELLHRRLRELPSTASAYRALGVAPPPKRIMGHTNDHTFMLRRAKELQVYLDALLQDPRLARCDEVRKFFSSVNELYAPDDGGSLLKSLTNNVDSATNRVRRAVGGVLDEGRERITTLSTSMRDSTRRMGGLAPRFRAVASAGAKVAAGFPPVPPLRSFASAMLPSPSDPATPPAPPPLIPAACSAPHPSSTPPPSSPLVSLEATSGSAVASTQQQQPPLPPPADSPPPLLTKAPPSALSSTSAASAPVLDWSGASRRTSQTLPADAGDAAGASASGNARARGAGRMSEAGVGAAEEFVVESAGVSAPLYSIVVAVFELQGRGFFRRQVVSLATQMLSLVAGDAIDSFVSEQLRSISSEPSIARWITALQSALWPGGVWYSTAATAAAAVAAAAAAQQPSPSSGPSTPSSSPTKAATASPKKSSSSILGHSKSRREPSGKLPKGAPEGGVSPTSAATAVAAMAAVATAAAAAAAAPQPGVGAAPSAAAAKAAYMTAETFMQHAVPADEAEVAERVRAKLFAAAPVALVRLVGQKCYYKSMTDVYEMLQSPTFTYQIGYRMLETLVMELFPELRES